MNIAHDRQAGGLYALTMQLTVGLARFGIARSISPGVLAHGIGGPSNLVSPTLCPIVASMVRNELCILNCAYTAGREESQGHV